MWPGPVRVRVPHVSGCLVRGGGLDAVRVSNPALSLGALDAEAVPDRPMVRCGAYLSLPVSKQ
jgi:hypothetical protein